MSIIKYPIFKYQQNDTIFINVVLPLSVLDAISEVLVYGRDTDGYQRLPNSIHYNRIKKYIQSGPENFILPTSIILGGDTASTNKLIVNENGVDYINLDTSKKMFRVVDGQHRIFGLNESLKAGVQVGNFPLNVIIVLSDDTNRSKELQIFSDINSKGKRINTDLAELAKHEYRIKENNVPPAEVNRHIAIKSAYNLKDKKGSNVWQNAIKFDIHSEIALGIIGVTIFSETIKGVIDQYIFENPYETKDKKLVGKDLIDYCNNAATIVTDFLFISWNSTIQNKWPGAFKEDIVKNDEGDLVKIFYRKDFYIQKGLGIKSINPIISDIVKQVGLNDEAQNLFKTTIFQSKVRISDWQNGGPFSGFNSESGFSKIKRIILNQESMQL